MENSLLETIEINYNQILNIVVSDLIKKYKSNIERGDQEWTIAFEKVLRYYLDEGEMYCLMTAINNNQLPNSPIELFE